MNGMTHPIHTFWSVSIGLKFILLCVIRRDHLFRAFIAMALAGSLVAWFLPVEHYAAFWALKSCCLAAFYVALTRAAFSRMGVRATPSLLAICAIPNASMAGVLAHAPWKYPLFAVPSSFCAFLILLGEGFAQETDWRALILAAYLIFDALNLYTAMASPMIGVCVGIATSVCYAAWIVFYLRIPRRRGRDATRTISDSVPKLTR